MAAMLTVEDLFLREYTRLVRALAVADDAAAVHEAFIAAGQRWGHVSQLEDPAGWVRRVVGQRVGGR